MVGLKDKYEKYFKIGTAVNISTLKSRGELIKTHFNSITCENEMKYDSFCTEEGIYRFFWPDEINEFARKNNIPIHGHVLVWHKQTPDYIFKSNPTREELLTCLRLHIKMIGNRYRETIKSWDVVNEVIDDKNGDFFRNTAFYRIIGDDYADCIFRMTREILPEKELYYNDYNECIPEKREKIMRLIKGMLSRGVPVDGIGMQSHINIYHPNIDLIKRALEGYASLGLKIRISELDVSMFEHEDRSSIVRPERWMYEKQAEVYGQIFKLYREYSDVIDSVTMWGVCDQDSWLNNFPVPKRNNWPLLFDENGEPKEAFYRITDF